MFEVGQKVSTPAGDGEVMQVRSGLMDGGAVRVQGSSWNRWFKQADLVPFGMVGFDTQPMELNESNSTVLPYNPNPPLPAAGYEQTSTIQPTHKTPIDKALKPTESLSGLRLASDESEADWEEAYETWAATQDDED